MPTNLKPFTGELDAPVSGQLQPFSGKLDDETQGEESIWDKLKGAEHAVTGMATQVPGALGGGFNYLATLAATRDPEAAMAVKQATEKAINDVVEYKPTDAAGKRYQENVGKAMQHAIEFGGRYPEQLAGTLGMRDFTPQEQLAMESLGRAGTEIGMNLVDPLAAVGVVKGGIGLAKGRMARAGAAEEAALAHSKLEGTLQPFHGELDTPAAPPEIPTIAHADDFAAFNPYDVGGHVSASEQGRPSVMDTSQGDLFGGQNLQEAQPQPTGGPLLDQVRYGGNEVPYEPLSLGEGTAQQPSLYGKEVPLAEHSPINRLELVPKNEEGYTTAQQAVADIVAPETMALEPQASAEAKPKTRYELAQEKIRKQEEAVAAAQRNLEARRAKGEKDMQYAEDVLGDRSIMQPDATSNMRGSIEAGDARGALDAVANNHPNRLIRDLAQYLSDKVEGLKISSTEEGLIRMGDRDATGYFDPATGEVVLSAVGANSPHTVLHEIVHGLTSQFMRGRPNDFRVRAVEALYKKLDLSDHPAISNAREFVAEAFSNPEFQDFLKKTRVDTRSAWGKFVDTVKGIFGIKNDPRMSTAFDHAIDLGKQIVEASDAPTRKSLMETFRDAGLNNKLADLMAVPEAPKVGDTQKEPGIAALKVPVLTDPISDFKFYDKSPAEIAELAKNSPDIPVSKVELAAQQLQSGGLAASLKTRNPIVKYAFERMSRADRAADYQIRHNLTDPKTGLKIHMRDMSAAEKGEIWSAQITHEGQSVLSTEQLRRAGYNEKQIAYYNHFRELSADIFKKLNDVREKLGMRPMDERIGHLAGRFMGDFWSEVKSADGTKVIARISGSTARELKHAVEFMKERHPDWHFGEQQYNTLGAGRNPGDRFGGLMEALNLLTKTDTDVATLLDSYKDLMQQDAVRFLNATRHAKAKVQEAGGIKGSEGNKPWLDMKKNAEQGMKAQLDYFEQAYRWMEAQKATEDIRQVTSDGEVVKAQPNAIKYANMYVDHALGRKSGPLGDAANWVASFIGEHTGWGHTNLFKASNVVKHRVLQKMMGYFNIPFSVAQLLQPVQSNPAMVSLLKSRGLEFSATEAQAKAMNTYFKSLTDTGKVDAFEQAALKYAADLGIFDMKMSDHVKDINSSQFGEKFDYWADMNIRVPEHFTRGNTFLFYSHLLKDAGIPSKDIFGAAENLTNFTMVDYRPMERPLMYSKLGWIGDVASALTRYKHNQMTQAAFYAREGIRGSGYAPLATYLGASLAFGGIMGAVGFQEADNLYQLFTQHVLKKPDSLTNQVLKSNMPEVMSHGLFSMLGVDMSSRFSNANLIPDTMVDAMMPYASAIWDPLASTGRVLMDPLSPTKWKQEIKSVAPQSVQGALENTMFTEKKGPNQNLYVTGTDGPNLGKGRVMRSDTEVGQRWLGFRSVRESKELAQNYSNSQIDKAQKEVVDSLLTKAKYAAMDDNLDATRLGQLAKQAADLGEDPNAFVSKIVSWSQDRQLTQRQQQILRNAQAGYQGAMNLRDMKQGGQLP